jgi:basic membrane protein A
VLTGASQQATGALRAVAEYKDKNIWWVGQDLSQLAMPESFKVLAAASYNYTAIVDAIIAKREAKVLGGENLPLNFANGGFVFKYNDKVGAVLTPAIRKAVDAAQKEMTAGKLPIAWKEVKF